MDDLEKKNDASLKRKVASVEKAIMDVDGSGQEHYSTPKKFKNIETLDGYECHKIIREILNHGHVDANAEVIIEHKGQESVEDLIHLMFEVPTVTSEVEKFKEKINSSSCDLSDGHIFIENVVIPSSEATIFSCISSKTSCQVSTSLMLGEDEDEEEVQGLLKRLEDVEGYETESWGSSLNSTTTPFSLKEKYSEDEKTLTLSQFLQDEAEGEEQLETEQLNNDKEGYSDTLINDTSTHIDVTQPNLGKKAHTNSDSCKADTINPKQSAHVVTPLATESTPGVPISSAVELYSSTGCKNSASNVVKEPDHDTEITPDFVLELVLAEGKANGALTQTDFSATNDSTITSPNEQQHFESFEFPYSSMGSGSAVSEVETNENHSIGQQSRLKTSDDIVDFIEELIQPSTSNRVVDAVETKSFVVDQQEVNTDRARKSSKECKASNTKVNAGETASVVSSTSSRSSVTDCSVVLERVEDMLDVNKCITSNHKKTSNGGQKVDPEKLRKQVLERWTVWKNIQRDKKKNETSMCSDVPKVCQIGSSAATASNVESVQQVENESETKLQDFNVSEDVHSADRKCDVVQKAVDMKESINENGVGFNRSSNTNSDTNIAVDLKNSRQNTAKVHSSQKREPRKRNYTQKQLIAMMKSEVLKKIPNISHLSEWMGKTFDRRKASLAESNYDLAEFVDTYPALKCYEIVKEEYGRLLNDVTKMATLEDKLMAQFQSVLALRKRRCGGMTKEHHLVEKSKQKWKDNPNCDPESKKILGMVCLAFHLAENAVIKNLCKLRREDQEPNVRQMLTPTLDVCESKIFEPNTEMWIYVDAVQYLKVPNFYEGVLCIYAIYWIYNIEYPLRLRLLFEFMDVLIGNPQSSYKGDITKLF